MHVLSALPTCFERYVPGEQVTHVARTVSGIAPRGHREQFVAPSCTSTRSIELTWFASQLSHALRPLAFENLPTEQS